MPTRHHPTAVGGGTKDSGKKRWKHPCTFVPNTLPLRALSVLMLPAISISSMMALRSFKRRLSGICLRKCRELIHLPTAPCLSIFVEVAVPWAAALPYSTIPSIETRCSLSSAPVKDIILVVISCGRENRTLSPAPHVFVRHL